MPRAPLPVTSVTHDGLMSSTTSKGVTPSSSLLRAHAPNLVPSSGIRVSTLISQGPCRLLRTPAGNWFFPTLSLQVFLRMLEPWVPSGLQGASACYFPCIIGLPQLPPLGRLSPNRPAKRLHAAGVSRSSLFLTFRPPGLLATQVSPTAAPRRPQGSRDFSTRADHAPLPLRASGMLAV